MIRFHEDDQTVVPSYNHRPYHHAANSLIEMYKCFQATNFIGPTTLTNDQHFFPIHFSLTGCVRQSITNQKKIFSLVWESSYPIFKWQTQVNEASQKNEKDEKWRFKMMFAGEIELHVGIWSAWKRKKRFGLSIEDLKNMRKGIISSSRMEILYLKKWYGRLIEACLLLVDTWKAIMEDVIENNCPTVWRRTTTC